MVGKWEGGSKGLDATPVVSLIPKTGGLTTTLLINTSNITSSHPLTSVERYHQQGLQMPQRHLLAECSPNTLLDTQKRGDTDRADNLPTMADVPIPLGRHSDPIGSLPAKVLYARPTTEAKLRDGKYLPTYLSFGLWSLDSSAGDTGMQPRARRPAMIMIHSLRCSPRPAH